MTAPVFIRRRFFDMADRQIHYRDSAPDTTVRPGDPPPLVLLHLLPGSARQMEPIMHRLAPRRCIAPDMPGTGDSDGLPLSNPTITDYAQALAGLLAHAGGGAPLDLYGNHTGAALAIELALGFPHLVRRVVLEGIPLFTPEEARDLIARYAPRVTPDDYGTYLLWVHNFCRDQILFYPWYDRSAAAARRIGLPPAQELSSWVVEVIKGLPGIPAAYHAAFSYPAAERLSGLTQPVLCLAPQDDTLFEATRAAVARLARGRLAIVGGHETDWQGAEALSAFLDGTEDTP